MSHTCFTNNIDIIIRIKQLFDQSLTGGARQLLKIGFLFHGSPETQSKPGNRIRL